ncbi:MAG: secretin N-terminal domain-containing protein [Nannocystaceae bacterium]
MSGDEGLNSCKQWKKGQRYTITIPPEAELEQLVKWMSTISCQKFIWNSKIRSGKVTVLSPESITLREAYAAFYAALESMGLTVEPTADYFKIVEIANAKALNLPIYDEYTAPNNDRYVTQLVRLDAADATEVAAVSKQGSIEVVGDLMIITERGSTVRRFQKIIKQLDRAEAGDRIFFYQLQFADANEVADIIREIFGEKSGGASSKSKSSKKSSRRSTSAAVDVSRVIVDDRTGTLIIVASPTDYSTVRRLVEQLDVRLPGGGGRIHVKPLKYADPKELATVLQSLTQTKSSSSKKKGKNKSAAGCLRGALLRGREGHCRRSEPLLGDRGVGCRLSEPRTRHR